MSTMTLEQARDLLASWLGGSEACLDAPKVAELYAMVSAIDAHLAQNAQGEATGYIVVKEHAWEHDDGGRTTLAYLWPSEFGQRVFPTADAAMEFIREEPGLPTGWVALPINLHAERARVPAEADVEFVPRWWDGSHGDAYMEGWNDCRDAMLAAREVQS